MTHHTHRSTDVAAAFRQKIETEMDNAQLARRLEQGDEDLFILDVRTPEVYRKSHIQGAVNLPADELDHRLHEIPRDKLVVTYCYDVGCRLSTQTGLELAEAGYERVKELVGGFETFEAKHPELVERFERRREMPPAH